MKTQFNKNQNQNSTSLSKNQINNQISKSKVSLTVLVFAIISMFSIGCGEEENQPCDTTNTLFHQIYMNAATAAGNTDRITMDGYIHQYNFTVSSNKEICSVGYQSLPAVSAQLYKIEIIDSPHTDDPFICLYSSSKFQV